MGHHHKQAGQSAHQSNTSLPDEYGKNCKCCQQQRIRDLMETIFSFHLVSMVYEMKKRFVICHHNHKIWGHLWVNMGPPRQITTGM